MFKPEKVNLDIKNLKYRYVNGKLFNTNGHDFVEIAGIKWATMNVGANKVTDTGLYFQWGDTRGYTADQVGKKEDGKKPFAQDWSDYKFTSDGGKTFSKYNSVGMTLALEDDPVHAAWGGDWRMPTLKEVMALIDAKNNSIVKVASISSTGVELHDNISNDTLFLPTCGTAMDGIINNTEIQLYWLGSLTPDNVNTANFWYGQDGGFQVYNIGRCAGICVRGVLDV